jgi:hypothetical protein
MKWFAKGRKWLHECRVGFKREVDFAPATGNFTHTKARRHEGTKGRKNGLENCWCREYLCAMDLNPRLRGSFKVWMAITIPLFLAMCCLYQINLKCEVVHLWGLWWTVLIHPSVFSNRPLDLLVFLGFWTAVYAVPTLIIGWVLQFPVCAAWDFLKARRSSRP